MTLIDVRGIDRAKLLAALVNGSRAKGPGLAISTQAPTCMTVDVASGIVAKRLSVPQTSESDTRLYFDYVWGRAVRMNLGHDHVDPFLYNRTNGVGLAEEIVARLRKQ